MICLDFPLNYLCCYIRKLNYDFVTLLKITEAVVLKLVGDEPYLIHHFNHTYLWMEYFGIKVLRIIIVYSNNRHQFFICACVHICVFVEIKKWRLNAPMSGNLCQRQKKFSTSFQSTWRAGKYNQDSENSRTVIPKVGINTTKFQRRE